MPGAAAEVHGELPGADPPGLAGLLRSDLGGAGIRRRRCGRGFRYLGPDQAAVTDPEVLARIRAR